MVTEIKPKCYTCLNPIALDDPFGFAGLTCCQHSDLDLQNNTLDHPRIADRLNSTIERQHTNNWSQT